MAREEAEVAAGGRACSLTTVHCGASCTHFIKNNAIFLVLVLS